MNTAAPLSAAPLSAALCAAAILLGACAAPGPASGDLAAGPKAPRSCFFAGNVNNFRQVDERTVNLRVGAGDVYQVTTFNNCNDVRWAQAIALETRGSSNVCTGLDVTLIVPSSLAPQRCPAQGLRKLSQAEVDALPPGQKP